MKILTRSEQNEIVDILAIIRVAMLDYENDPVGTTSLVNKLIVGKLVGTIGGKKGYARCAKKMEELFSEFTKKGLMEGLSCDKKV